MANSPLPTPTKKLDDHKRPEHMPGQKHADHASKPLPQQQQGDKTDKQKPASPKPADGQR